MKTVSPFDLVAIIKNIQSKLDGLELGEGNKPHVLTQEDESLLFGYDIIFRIYNKSLYLESINIYDEAGREMYLPYEMWKEVIQTIESYVKKYYNQ